MRRNMSHQKASLAYLSSHTYNSTALMLRQDDDVENTLVD
jgi:hypothetical protein